MMMTTLRQINADLIIAGKVQNYWLRDAAQMAGVDIDSEEASATYLDRKMAHLHSLIERASTADDLRAATKEHSGTIRWMIHIRPAEMQVWNKAAIAKFGPK